MPVSLIPSFVVYAFLSSITPGPANLCSLSAALRSGKKTALRQWRGLFTGFAVISLISVVFCYFIGEVLGTYVQYFTFVGAIYLFYLAFKMLKSSIKEGDDGRDQCNFMTGLIVNLTNVKIMIYTVTSLSIYVLPYSNKFTSLLALGVVLPFTGPMCNLVWLFLGDYLRRFFLKWQKQVNIVMALSLAAVALSLIF